MPPGEVGEIFLRWPAGGLYHYLGGAPVWPSPTTASPAPATSASSTTTATCTSPTVASDLIITGGANVYPAEVESALVDHPASPTSSSSVWPTRSGAGGCTPSSSPATRPHPPTADEVIAFAKSRLAGYKVPKTVEIVERIPRSEATKVSRSGLIAEREPPS